MIFGDRNPRCTERHLLRIFSDEPEVINLNSFFHHSSFSSMEIFETNFLKDAACIVTKTPPILSLPPVCLHHRVSLRAFGREPSVWTVQREDDTKKSIFLFCTIFSIILARLFSGIRIKRINFRLFW